MIERHAAPAHDDRRTRWARAENSRRHEEYNRDLAAWQADAAELDWMVATARTFTGTRDSSLDLKRTETAFFELPQARIVEEPAGRAVLPGSPDFSFRSAKALPKISAHDGSIVTGAPIVKAGDAGRLVVTDHRVVLMGQRNREWSFAKLIQLGHDEWRPLTLMHVSTRQKVSGLLYDAGDAPRFRFFLGLALAHFRDDVPAFAADIERQRFEHVGSAPTAPVVVTPAEAPSAGGLLALGRGVRTVYTGKTGWPRKTRVIWGVVAASVTLFAGSAVANAGQSAPASHHQTRFVSTSTTAAAKPTHPTVPTAPTTQAPRRTSAPITSTAPHTATSHSSPPHTAVATTPAPVRTTPVQTTHVPPPITTQAPPPAPPSSAPPATCYPLTNGGNCYEPGEYCRNRDHGASGVAGDGENITCEDNDGWRWEPTG